MINQLSVLQKDNAKAKLYRMYLTDPKSLDAVDVEAPPAPEELPQQQESKEVGSDQDDDISIGGNEDYSQEQFEAVLKASCAKPTDEGDEADSDADDRSNGSSGLKQLANMATKSPRAIDNFEAALGSETLNDSRKRQTAIANSQVAKPSGPSAGAAAPNQDVGAATLRDFPQAPARFSADGDSAPNSARLVAPSDSLFLGSEIANEASSSPSSSKAAKPAVIPSPDGFKNSQSSDSSVSSPFRQMEVSTTAPKSLSSKRQLSPSVTDDTPKKASNTGVQQPKTPGPAALGPILGHPPPRSRMLNAEQQDLLQALSKPLTAPAAPARSSPATRGAAAQSPSKRALNTATATPASSNKPPKPASPAQPSEDPEDSEMAAKKPAPKPKGKANRRH